MNTEAIEKYAEAIELHWSRQRGAMLLFSPKDIIKIEAWFELGIPLETVKKGINRYFEKVTPEDRRKRIVLSFAEGNILEEWKLQRAGGASGSGRLSLEEEAAEQKKRVAAFVLALRKRRGACETWICRLLDELVEEHDGAASLDVEKIEEQISAFLKANGTPERMRTARLAAERKLATYRDKMVEEVYRKVLETNMLETLRIELGIPNPIGEE